MAIEVPDPGVIVGERTRRRSAVSWRLRLVGVSSGIAPRRRPSIPVWFPVTSGTEMRSSGALTLL
ncbi:MAG: hypothetical protein DCE92_11240 [Alphaproteobacteria bacterium]|nr:MAG: hypothetical protein DCE92_11240 [Alphaproteobacteria bacterium]